MMRTRRNPTRYRAARERFKALLPGTDRDKNAIVRYLNEFDVEWGDVKDKIQPWLLIITLRNMVTASAGLTAKASDAMTKRALDACAEAGWKDQDGDDIDQTYPASAGVELSLALLGSPMANEMLWVDYPSLYKAIRDRKKRKPRENPTKYHYAAEKLRKRLVGFSKSDEKALISVLRDLDIEFDAIADHDTPNVTFREVVQAIHAAINTQVGGRHLYTPDGMTQKAEELVAKAGLSFAADRLDLGILISLFAAGSDTARDQLHPLAERLMSGPRVRPNPTRYQRAASDFKQRLDGFDKSDVRALISVLKALDIEFDSIAEPDETVTLPQAISALRSAIEIQIGRHPVAADAITDRAGRFLDAFDRVVVKAFSIDEGILLSLAAAGSFLAQETILISGSRVGEKFVKRVRGKTRGVRQNPTRYQTARKRFAERISWGVNDPKDLSALVKVMKDLDIEYEDVLALVGDDPNLVGFADVVSALSDIIVRSQDLPYAYAPQTLTSKGQRWYELLHSDEQIYFSTAPVMYGIWLSLALEGSPRAKRHIEKQSWWQHWLRISKHTKL